MAGQDKETTGLLTEEGWDFRFDCTEFVLSVFLYSRFIVTVNLFVSLPNQYKSHKRLHLKGLLRKNGRGYSLKTNHFSSLNRDTRKLYLMFLSREINIELCQIYTKIHVYTILYRNSRFKQIIFSKYATNQKTKIGFLQLIFHNFYFYFK